MKPEIGCKYGIYMTALVWHGLCYLLQSAIHDSDGGDDMKTLKTLMLAAFVLLSVTEMPTPEGLKEFPTMTHIVK